MATRAYRVPTLVGLLIITEKARLKSVLYTPSKQGRRQSPVSSGVLTAQVLSSLRSSGILPIQLFAQPLEVRIEGHESGRSLKEGHAARIMRHAIQRTLAIAGRQITATG